MKYLNKRKITVFTTFSILLLILTSFVLCNPSIAHYKTRITVDTVNLEITPYQPVNTVVEETPIVETNEDEEPITNEIVEEQNSDENIILKEDNLLNANN